ncbi:MAG: hypothetical protein Q8R82_12005 [Hyphomonadaceae bacterium]|nr:hypothetical protein [Hyphomonadaceae bacterium]
MLVRIIQFLIGAVLAGGGGYLAWTHRSGGMDIFPPAAGMPWLVIAGVLGLSAGIVFLVSAVHPRPQRKARLAALAATRDATLGAAEDYYSERGRAADRDWRAGDVPAPVAPVAAAPVVAAPVVEPVRVVTPPVAPVAAQVKPVATSAPPAAAVPEVFPATATLAPIPAAAEPPPAPPKPQEAAPVEAPVEIAAVVAEPAAPLPAPAPVAPAAAAPEDPIAAIRAALAAGQLDEVDKLLNARRESAQGLELAELTGLAGDHAAAMGRASNAKWLWRLSLKRFGELKAMDTAAAKAVAENLRVSG